MKDICNKILAAFALLFFAACGLIGIFMKDVEFSEDENRYLKTFEKPTFNSIVKAEYQTELTDYLTDQVVFRSDFMKVYGLGQSAFMKTEYNGVYMCDDDYLIEVYKEPVNTESIVERLNKVSGKVSAHCMLLLAPTAVTVYSEKLPSNVSYKRSQLDVMRYMYENAKMDSINVYDSIMAAKNDEQMYYRTDHHWTTDAAYLAYVEFCKKNGFEPVAKDKFNIETVSNEFYGTVYSKALKLGQKADSIKVYKQDLTGVTIKVGDKTGLLYNEEYLKVKDKYAYFLDGNLPVINISNSNVKNGKKLLVIKDSYANCFVPFLINHYEEIMVLDTRYYKRGVTKTANEWGATDILFLFNLNTLDTDALVRGIF